MPFTSSPNGAVQVLRARFWELILLYIYCTSNGYICISHSGTCNLHITVSMIILKSIDIISPLFPCNTLNDRISNRFTRCIGQARVTIPRNRVSTYSNNPTYHDHNLGFYFIWVSNREKIKRVLQRKRNFCINTRIYMRIFANTIIHEWLSERPVKYCENNTGLNCSYSWWLLAGSEDERKSPQRTE